MKQSLKKIIVIIGASILYVMPPVAMAATAQFAPDQQALIQKLQTYLNGIRTLQANFIQANPNGATSSGKIYIKRLGKESFGKLRLEYTPPTFTRIIANGETLRHEDGETKEVNEYPIDSTPASFLLRPRIDFFNDLEVKTIEVKEDKVALTIIRPGDEGVSLTLVFITSPMVRLQGWTVVDAQANKTQLTLNQLEIGIPLDERLFTFPDYQ